MKVKMFHLNKRLEDVEENVNAWLAQNPTITVTHTAGSNVFLFIFYKN
jgi:hypothetical protein